MDTNKFKQLASTILVDLEFEKKGNFFYRNSNNIIYVIGMQWSKYSNGYYFNLGYIIKELHPGLDFPKDSDGDIRTRFSYKKLGEDIDIIELDSLPLEASEFLRNFLLQNISELILNVEKNGVNWLLKKDPTILYQTTIKAKEYLNIS